MTNKKTVKKKSSKVEREVVAKAPSFDAKKEINDVLDMIKNITEILHEHQAIINKIKGRMGI
jgi:hypothetical protein